MTYETAQALRMALEQRLLTRSRQTGVALDRLRRRVLFERVVARLHSAEPGRWVLKGGMALEVRLADRARLTKDLDLGLRDEVTAAEELRERLVELLAVDLDGDRFATEHDMQTTTFVAAAALVEAMWSDMFPRDGS